MDCSRTKNRKRTRRGTPPTSRRFNSVAYAAACGVYSALSGRVASECLSLLNEGEFLSLLNVGIDPTSYRECDTETFRDDYLAVSLLSKADYLNTGVDREAVAMEKFHASEQACAATNVRLRTVSAWEGTTDPLSAPSILCAARNKIESVLGPFSWDEAARHMRFGPGATFNTPRSRADAYYKFGQLRPATTKGNAMVASVAIAMDPRWYMHLAGIETGTSFCMPGGAAICGLLEYVEGNRVVTVPKNAKTDRTIAIEPLMNSFVQMGIGGVMTDRLKRVGIDLSSQERNQILAWDGSLTGCLSTIDLSAASDSVSTELVRRILPPDWYDACCSARCEVGVLPSGDEIRYQKFSSMGNGFTFPLETLIFWGILSALMDRYDGMERRTAVYGDDIICPTAVAGWLIDVLAWVGFKTNPDKSFTTGWFRESCGMHFFAGSDVTPIYISNDVVTEIEVIKLCNLIRRYARRRCPYWGLDGRFRGVYQQLVGRLRSHLRRPSIPDGYGDSALFGDLDEVTPRRDPCGRDGWLTHSYEPAFESVGYSEYIPALLARFRPNKPPFRGEWWEFTGDRPTVDGVILPRRRLSRINNLFVHQWPSFGHWTDP